MTPASTTPEPRRPRPAGRWRARASASRSTASFEAPGLPPRERGAHGSAHDARAGSSPRRSRRGWPCEGVERVLEESFEGEAAPPARSTRTRGTATACTRVTSASRGSRPTARGSCARRRRTSRGAGSASSSGGCCRGQSLLRGHEVLHASAVAFGGRAVAFVGETGAGKTSLAIQLVRPRRGVLDRRRARARLRPDGAPGRTPGAGIASVRPPSGSRSRRRPGAGSARVLGHSGKTYLELPRRSSTRSRSGAVCFLERGRAPPSSGSQSSTRAACSRARSCLACRRPQRLINQLDVCSAIARDCRSTGLRDVAASAGALAARRRRCSAVSARVYGATSRCRRPPAALAGEILAAYVEVVGRCAGAASAARWRLCGRPRRRPTLRRGRDMAGRRLGHAVARTLRVLPADSRCLMQSLVLTRLLARRGIATPSWSSPCARASASPPTPGSSAGQAAAARGRAGVRATRDALR